MKFPIAAATLFLATASAFAPQSAFVNKNSLSAVAKSTSAIQMA
jgi:hypothetical protein